MALGDAEEVVDSLKVRPCPDGFSLSEWDRLMFNVFDAYCDFVRDEMQENSFLEEDFLVYSNLFFWDNLCFIVDCLGLDVDVRKVNLVLQEHVFSNFGDGDYVNSFEVFGRKFDCLEDLSVKLADYMLEGKI